MDLINLAPLMKKRRYLVEVVINTEVIKNSGDFLTS